MICWPTDSADSESGAERVVLSTADAKIRLDPSKNWICDLPNGISFSVTPKALIVGLTVASNETGEP